MKRTPKPTPEQVEAQEAESLERLLTNLVECLQELKDTVAANTLLLSSFIHWVKNEEEHEA